MKTGYVLYNEMAGQGESNEPEFNFRRGEDELRYCDIREIEDFQAFAKKLLPGDYIIISGGDGTLNRFINSAGDAFAEHEIYYCPEGTGNDFARDLGYMKGCAPFSVNTYCKNLPTVVVNGARYHFLNGIGYGIDGYCCAEGDRMKSEGEKNINYGVIAVKGLLFHYRPTGATVTVDGVIHTYKKVWLAPTMNGRYYGGGMMPTPDQKRNSGELSVMVFHGSDKIRTLMIFPSIFNGAHTKYREQVEILKGKDITVEFDRPTALQIDGESIPGVSSYRAFV